MGKKKKLGKPPFLSSWMRQFAESLEAWGKEEPFMRLWVHVKGQMRAV